MSSQETALRSAREAPSTNGGAPPPSPEWALGPGAVAWKLFRDPAVFIVGILGEAMLLQQHLPFGSVDADGHDGVHRDPVLRFGTVARYQYSLVYGTPKDADRVSGFVRRAHNSVKGVEPVTGKPYQANADYELVLTHVLLVYSYLNTYELLHGRLSDGERDQYVLEAQGGGARLGIRHELMPSTYRELHDWLEEARTRFAIGFQARDVLKPFAKGEYPPGSVIAELPPLKRRAAQVVVKALVDMAMLTWQDEDRHLIAIDRPPVLRSRRATKVSLRLLSAWLSRPKGQAAFDKLLKNDVAAIRRRAREAEAAAGGHEAAARTFTPHPELVPVAELDEHQHNMPASGS